MLLVYGQRETRTLTYCYATFWVCVCAIFSLWWFLRWTGSGRWVLLVVIDNVNDNGMMTQTSRFAGRPSARLKNVKTVFLVFTEELVPHSCHFRRSSRHLLHSACQQQQTFSVGKETHRASYWVWGTDSSRFRHRWMFYQSAFHFKRPNPVSAKQDSQLTKTRMLPSLGRKKDANRSVSTIICLCPSALNTPSRNDDIVWSSHEPQVSLFVLHSAVTRQIVVAPKSAFRPLWFSLVEQVRFVSVKAERPNHPSRYHARQGGVSASGGGSAGRGMVVGGGSSMTTMTQTWLQKAAPTSSRSA